MFANLSLFSTIRIALVAMCLDARSAEPIEDDLADFTSDLHQLHHAVTDPNSDLKFIISNFFTIEWISIDLPNAYLTITAKEY